MERYIADIHFGHHNIIEKENRPFKDLDDMHNGIRERWNDVTSDEDDTWILGDVVGGKKVHLDQIKNFMDSLKGRKHLILGNHDDMFRPWTWHKAGFSSVHTVVEHFIQNNIIHLAHYPNARELYDIHKSATLFHGHSHSKGYGNFHCDPGGGWSVNVSVELWDYTSISFEDILKFINLEKQTK